MVVGYDTEHAPPLSSRLAALPRGIRFGILSAVVVVVGVCTVVLVLVGITGGPVFDIAWALLWLILMLGWLVLIIPAAIALFKLGARKETPRWWVIVVGLFLLVVLLPILGLIPAAVVLMVERRTKSVTNAKRADWGPPVP